jgi:hypothetical protein
MFKKEESPVSSKESALFIEFSKPVWFCVVFWVPPLGGAFTQRPPLEGTLKPPALRVVDDVCRACSCTWRVKVPLPTLWRSRLGSTLKASEAQGRHREMGPEGSV